MSNQTITYLETLEIAKQDIKTALMDKGVTPKGGYTSYAEAISGIEIPTIEDRKGIEITENGKMNILPDEGYDAVKIVTVDVNVEIPTFETQQKTITIDKNGSQTVKPDSGYDGLDSVTIDVDVEPKLQSKSVVVTENGKQSIEADEGYDGIHDVSLTVDVPIPTFETQSKYITIGKNGTQTLTPDEGYDGLELVEITVDVASGGGGGDSGKPKISNGFRFTGGDMSLIDWALYDWSNVYNFSHFFTNCTASDPTWTIRFGEHVINKMDHPICFDNMFIGSKFTELDLSSWDTSRVISMSALCYECKDLTKINITGWDYSGLMSPDDCLVSIGDSPLLDSGTSVMFGCSNISEIIGSVFLGKYMSRYIQKSGSGLTDVSWAPQPFTSNNLGYPDLIFDDDLTRLDYYFYDIQSSDLSKLSNINTSNVTTISNIFYQNQSMTSLNDISGWDTHNVKDMSYAFYNCSKLSNIEALNNWDLGKVEDLSYTFGANSSYNKVPINSINMSIFTNPNGYKMDYTFMYSDIQNIEGVCRPTSLRYTFERSEITKVTIDLSQCTNITQCFNQCKKLMEVTLIGDPSKLTTISNVFSGTNSGVTLYYDSNYDYSKLSIPSSWTQIPL